MGQRQGLWKCLGTAAFATAIAALFAIADPMGLDAAADRHSAGVIARMTALYYGDPTPSRPVSGQSQVLVVQVSDATLTDRAIPWPPTRDFYSEIVSTLAAQKPAAIFLDYMLVSEFGDGADRAGFIKTLGEITHAERWTHRPDCRATPLSKIRCIIDAGGVPVLLGKAYPPDVCGPITGRELSSDMIDQDGVAVLTPLGWPELPDSYRPLLQRDDYRLHIIETYKQKPSGDEPNRTSGGQSKTKSADKPDPAYELPWTCRTLNPRPDKGWYGVRSYDLSPALALYAADCLREGSPLKDQQLCRDLHVADPNAPSTQLGLPEQAVVSWGSRPDPQFLEWRAKLYDENGAPPRDCAQEQRSLGRIIHVGLAQLASAIGEGEAGVRVSCPYHPTLDYALLGSLLSPVAGHSDAERRAKSLVTGRVVLVGASMAGGNDWIETVVHGRQPGVHLHAMAFDNLIEDGAALRQEPWPVFDKTSWWSNLGLDWGEVLELTCAFLVAIVVEAVRLRIKRGGLRHQQVIGLITSVFVFGVLVLIVAVAVTQSAHWTPVNVVGLFTFTLVDGGISFWDIEGCGWLVAIAAAAAAPFAHRLLAAATRWRRFPPPPTPPTAPELPQPPSTDPLPETEAKEP
jgi:hypothetical protein